MNLFESDVDTAEITAADVMTTDPLVVQTDNKLPHVLHHMDEGHVRRIPVIDEDEALTGIPVLDDVIVHLGEERIRLGLAR